MKTGNKLLTGTLSVLCAALLVFCSVLALGWSKAAKTNAALPEVRNNGTAIQWKYSNETDWRDLVALTELRGAAGENGIDGVDGKVGINGKSIVVQRAETHIQWRYEGDEWQNLVAIADITGPAGQKGADGANGKTPEFRVNENTLQWRYVGDEIWLNLYDLSVLKGLDGKDGADGKDGTNGINGQDGRDGADGNTPFIGENGNWWIGETDTGIKAAGTDGKDGINGIDGTNGKEIEIQKTDLYIQWRYKGGEWQNLVALADILGPSGQNGTDGEDGKTPEFRVNGNQLQWRYEGETIWLNLYDLSVLKGADGKDGSCAGYFAANGRVYSWGTPLPFNVKKESGDLISYDSSSKTITLSKGHTYSMVFSGTVMISANGTYKWCGASLIDGYNSSEMMLETRTYVSMIDDGQSARLGMSYNTIYSAEKDIALTFQYTNMLFQNTNFTDSQYNITIIALD